MLLQETRSSPSDTKSTHVRTCYAVWRASEQAQEQTTLAQYPCGELAAVSREPVAPLHISPGALVLVGSRLRLCNGIARGSVEMVGQ